MVLWFVGTAVAAVWFVFRDERFDNRVLALGALLPDVIDGLAGGMWVGHSVLAPTVAMGVVMAATRTRKPLRRSLLALPIGMFLHLIFDGAFAATATFWWPAMGVDGPTGSLPVVDRGWWNLPLELAGAALCAGLWRFFGLSDPARRATLLSSGALRGPGAGGAGQC